LISAAAHLASLALECSDPLPDTDNRRTGGVSRRSASTDLEHEKAAWVVHTAAALRIIVQLDSYAATHLLETSVLKNGRVRFSPHSPDVLRKELAKLPCITWPRTHATEKMSERNGSSKTAQ
jgi:hypothetical protein